LKRGIIIRVIIRVRVGNRGYLSILSFKRWIKVARVRVRVVGVEIFEKAAYHVGVYVGHW
jgi:hypothetical protein